ncbi:TetR/AcrR family transcriptional regulator [Pseudonocardia sp. TRM90224]|uniref:TetR/AcrR family transcriptional regulator n=1 Tax=Pseudonocardia sp. TRM90224 TaxID=2812678 RepID=UPI001E5E0CA8|nr:TetR/AcrR family transcriptional regulator [Pseudonocardia sp. TRM90224]
MENAGRRAPTLSADTIVTAALDLAEREGPAALTLRRLGKEMGVDATAFYRYFRDKDELVLAVGDRMIGSVLEQVRSAQGDWRDVLRAVAAAFQRQVEVRPAVFSMIFARVTGGPAERKVVELILAALAPLGLPTERAALLYRLFVDTLLSLGGMAATVRTLPPEIVEKDETAWSRVYAGMPHADFPATREHASALVGVTDDGVYAAAVDALIAFIEAEAGAAGVR